ncbi:MAG: YkgJ family cysteine cluster protein [Thermoleophilia bacterium]|jgi:Fe-S-cluster containining protein
MKKILKKSENSTTEPDLTAGDFSSWLRHARSSLIDENGTDLDCGKCTACCSSSLFIHIRPEETATFSRIHPDIPVAAPGRPKGHVLLGYDRDGICPMLIDGKCSIYEQRPLTCRNYDCRIFAAAGITAGDEDKARINQRIRCWKFNYPTGRDRDEHLAVQAAAKFIREHAECFPGGKIPGDPSQLAIIAIKVYDVFLKIDGGSAKTGRASEDTEAAKAIVEACRNFDARIPASIVMPREVLKK